MVSITYTDGGQGTAAVEAGKHGGPVLVLRRNSGQCGSVVIGGVKVEHATVPVLASLGVATTSMDAVALMLGEGE